MAIVVRITRLHMVLAFIGLICLSLGGYNWFKAHPRTIELVKKTEAPPPPPVDTRHQDAARLVAQVGEAYTPYRKKFGNVAPISTPLREAKQRLAAGDDAGALASARDAWRALKIYREKIKEYSDAYEVVRGDTLWRIAAAHSPAHAGAGWVTIWKANQTQIPDFNRIEVGWTLTIPPKPTQYVMPFWKPLGIN